jgi:hypothetical protein
MSSEPARPKEVAHDETPSIIIDHQFVPRGEWWSLCKQCNLAESAHKETTLNPVRDTSENAPLA